MKLVDWRAGTLLWRIWLIVFLTGLAASAIAVATNGLQAAPAAEPAEAAQQVITPVDPEQQQAWKANRLLDSLSAGNTGPEVIAGLGVMPQDFGVRIVGAALRPGRCKTTDLCADDVEVSVDAAYPSFKTWLATVLERQPNVTLKRLSIRAPVQGERVAATLELKVWQRGTELPEQRAASGLGAR